MPELNDKAAALLETVRLLAEELHPRKGGAVTVTLESLLDRDLGFDSLGRMELLTRLERTFGVVFPEQLLVEAETPRALLEALLTAHAKSGVTAMAKLRWSEPGKAEAAPGQAATLLEVLEMHLRIHPQRTHIVLTSEAGEDEELSYEALQQGAEAVAAGLGKHELQPGQAVAIMLPTSRDYFYSFFGILLAGGIPVPIYPPARLAQIEDHLRRHAGILANARAAMIITLPEALPLARLLKSQVEGLRHLFTVQELSAPGGKFTHPGVNSGDIALLQYTSGSTGNPKGVVLTHANLLANIRAMGEAAGVSSTDLFVSWLPLYHDMGLIGAWLGSLYYACPLVIMSPLAFLARPERWLRAIHSHRGTLSAAPNFAYELCLRKIADSDIEGLDLSSWRMAFNGAEPVSPETALAFQTRFAGYGLRPGAMSPVYGLAESSVGLAFPPPGRGILVDRIRRDIFESSGRAVPAEEGQGSLRFVACGRPLPGHQIRIVDAAGRETGEREEGRLEFSGPSVTSGYFHNPEESARLFRGEWADSGDFAYIAQGEIYLTGRSKDMIIRAGRNIFPYELEEAIGSIPEVRRGCVAVFGVPDPASGTERLVVLAETREKDPGLHEGLRSRIIAVTVDLLGEPPDDVVLALPHTVLKTSSGKIRRAASREAYLHGETGAGQRAVWRQLAGFALTGFWPLLRRSGRAFAGILYAAYVWALFSLLAPLTWGVAVLMPRPAWCWRVSRIGARILAALSATPIAVQGEENLPFGPCVLTVNHSSYLDGMVLVAALPRNYSFVAKRELLGNMIPRLYLQRLGADFVERFDLLRGVEDAERLAQSARSGKSMIFFPEGTFKRMPGLLPFRLGAFVVAAQGGLPVIPVVIRGTRSILRADNWLPRRGAITVGIGRPVLPDGPDWSAAIRLRDRVRGEMLRQCGEPDQGEYHASK